MAQTIIKGDELMVFKGTTALAYATAHTLSINGNTIDISSKDHGYWGASEIGNITWEVTTENLFTETDYDSLFSAMIAKTPIDIVFAKAGNYDANGLKDVGTGTTAAWTKSNGYKGKAIISSLSVNANTGENATYSATFTGVGALVKETE
jgi:TP901-1 family phage major tail protein